MLTRLPPLDRPEVRRAALHAFREIRFQRARLFEACGLPRYSAPADFGMDRHIAAIAGSGGFFVEAGANDGYRASNTYLLERRFGWRGVLIEPLPDRCRTCARRRKGAHVFNCALVAAGYSDATINIRYGDLGSAIGGTQQEANWGLEASYDLSVPARTLTDILDEVGAPRPDLLSLDVEGYEAQALAGLDLDRYAPRFILLEAWDRNLSRFGARLENRYELLEWLSPRDVLLAHRQ